ncbi:MAG TPA: CHRD domain-containing protein [Thermoanaerobaculia bacterium]
MRPRAVFVSLAIALLFVGSVSAQTLGAVMTGSQETPAPCATSGFGNATVTFDSTRQNINVTITVSNLGSPINNFHIHEAPAGASGNVVINLIGLGGMFVNGTMTGTFSVSDATSQGVVGRMLQNPGNFYVNVHTVQCPGGAIRGQLAFNSGGPIMYAAQLRGANEVPPVASNAFGSALVTFDPNTNFLAWEVATSGIVSPTLSHIHRGSSSVSGGVIISFATGPTQIPNGRTNGTITLTPAGALTAADITALGAASTANGYYVNVHSTAFGSGEIRGQLVPAQEVDIPVAGHVTGATGQTFVTDLRIFNPSFTDATTALVEFFNAGTTANTNATNSMAVNLPARGTAVLNDVAGANGLNTNALGAIRVSSVGNIVATSRIFVNTTNGSFGQFVPAFSRASALRRGVMPQVSNAPLGTAGFRANLGAFNPNQAAATVRLEVRDSAGTVLGSNLVTLQALSQQQNGLASYFPGVDLANQANLTVSFDASAGVFVYVAETDNQSSDSFLIPAQPDPGVAAQQQ